jgi:hypothetical protein
MQILWSWEHANAPCLPCAVGEYHRIQPSFPADSVLVTVKVTHRQGAILRSDIEFVDRKRRLVARMTGCEAVIDAGLARAFQLRTL